MSELLDWMRKHRRDILIVTVLIAVELSIKLYFLQFYRVISADGIGYANIGRALLQPGGLSRAIHYPPLYPFLIGVVDLFLGDVELAGRLVSVIMGSLIVVPLYLLGSLFYSRKVGLMACLLAISWSSLRFWSGEVMSQATYITILFTGFYFLAKGAIQRSTPAAVAAGVMMGFAYLTRPEAFIVLVAATPFVMARARIEGGSWKQAVTVACAAWLPFWLLAFPYVLLLHHEYGGWQLTGKTGATLWVGLGQYLDKFDVYRQPDFKPIGFLDVIRDYPGFIPYNVKNNIRDVARDMLPPYYWVLAFAGFLSGGWSRQHVIDRLFLLASFAPLLVIMVFFLAGPEYTQLSLPVLLIWTGQGAAAVECFLMTRMPGLLRPLMQRSVLSVLIIGSASLMSMIRQVPGPMPPYHHLQDGGRYDHKRIALLLKKHLPAGTVLMTRSGRIGFYSGHPTVDIPQADLATILAQARTSRVDFLIVDGLLMNQRPQMEVFFQPLLIGPEQAFYYAGPNGFMPIPGLRLYMVYRDPSSLGVAVYQVLY